MKKFLLVVLTFGLASCVNPYTRFYRGVPDARKIPGYEPAKAELQIYTTNNFKRDMRVLFRQGYVPVGQAAFNAPTRSVTEWELRQQAAKIGAQAVLISSKYAYTVSGAMPFTVPQTSTSFTTGTATAYGPGGTVTAYGSGMTTTYGTETMMMPFSIPHSDFDAVFFAKVKTQLGVYCLPLDDATRQRLQTNAGVKVLEVMDGSAAFRENILPGDVILAIGNDQIDSAKDLKQLLLKYQGQSVVFHLNRAGRPLDKRIEVPLASYAGQ